MGKDRSQFLTEDQRGHWARVYRGAGLAPAGRRRRTGLPRVAIVGYTNSGKSIRFSRLTGSNALALDKLFCTLDTRVRRAALAEALADHFAQVRLRVPPGRGKIISQLSHLGRVEGVHRGNLN